MRICRNTGRTWFKSGNKVRLEKRHSELTKEKMRNSHLGKRLSVDHKLKISLGLKGNKNWRSTSLKRWEGYTSKEKKSRYYTYSQKYPNGATEKKRFTNMRYRVRKRNAEGSHTFEDWLIVKSKFHNMCLCCKRFEPEIKLTEDHIIPLSMGGSDYIENIQPLCGACNTRKHAVALSYLTYRDNVDLYGNPEEKEGGVIIT